jgi:hypothetical protein
MYDHQAIGVAYGLPNVSTRAPLSLDPWTGSSSFGALIEKVPSGSG